MRRYLLIGLIVIMGIIYVGCGPNISIMVQNLENPSAEVREQAIKDLIEVGAPAVEPVVPLLGSQNPHTREAVR